MAILGNDIVEILPQSGGQNAAEVKFNGKKASFNQKSSDSFQDEDGNTVIQVYALPSGTVRLIGQKNGIEILFDGQRVKLQASNNYRGQMRGLCGTFDGQSADDFTSPKNCVLKNPYEFAASYAVPDSSLTSPAKELRQRAEQADCYKQTVMLGDVINENEAGRSSKKSWSKSSSNSNGRSQASTSPSSLRVKVIEHNGQTCFSLRPYVTCASRSQEANKIEKSVDFHCVSDAQAARRWVEQIKKGANPDFSQKGANHRATIRLPGKCNA